MKRKEIKNDKDNKEVKNSLAKNKRKVAVVTLTSIVVIVVGIIATASIINVQNKAKEKAKAEEQSKTNITLVEKQINGANDEQNTVLSNEQEASLNENNTDKNNTNASNSNVSNINTSNSSSGSNSSESKKPKALVEDEKITVYTDSNNEQAPIPRGYTVSSVEAENKVKTGLVIYEGTDSVTSSNLETAQKTRNQWVWVPVPDSSEMYGTDANRKKVGKVI